MSLSAWTFKTVSTQFPWGALKYSESQYDSGEAMMSDDSSDAQRLFVMDWDQRVNFMQDVLGGATYDALQPTGINRVLPEMHPDYADFYAFSAKVRPRGRGKVNGNSGAWDVAFVDTVFRPADFAIRDNTATAGDELNRFVRRQVRGKGDYLQLNINAFKWVTRPANEKPLGATPGIIVAGELAEYTWLKVPSLPNGGGDINKVYRCPVEPKIIAQLGTVNDAVFDTVYPAGTVLFTAAEAEMAKPNINTGQLTWTIKYYFEVKNHGAGIGGETAGVNYLYDPVNSRWDLVTSTGAVGGQRLYQSSNFNNLFKLV